MESPVSKWSVTHIPAADTEAVATKAAEATKSHFVTSLHASFSMAAIGLLTLKDGATVIGNFHVHNSRDVVFPAPIKITQGAAAVGTLAASSGTTIGTVTMFGFTVG